MRPRIWIALHALVVLVPIIGALTHAPDAVLFGVQAEGADERPKITLAGWRAETVQPALQEWYEGHIGFRGAMVRTDNSIQTAAFGETKPGSAVVVGEKGVLFYGDDLRFAAQRHADLAPVLERLAHLTHSLGSLQQKLAARGKTVVVLISPSKTALYPEAVPARWRRAESPTDIELSSALRTGLEANGVTFADGRAILAATPAADRERVFMKTSRHWTTVGSCLVLRAALRNGPITPICDYDSILVNRTTHVDYDLFNLLNTWHLDEEHRTVLHVRPSTATGHRPRTVLVGTSFLWMLVGGLEGLVEDPIVIFYNRTAFSVGASHRRLGTVDPTTPAWEDWVLNRDLYILELLETYAADGYMQAFVDALAARLD